MLVSWRDKLFSMKFTGWSKHSDSKILYKECPYEETKQVVQFIDIHEQRMLIVIVVIIIIIIVT